MVRKSNEIANFGKRIIGRQVVNKQTEGKHNLYIDMLKERQSTMENDRLNANIPKNFLFFYLTFQ